MGVNIERSPTTTLIVPLYQHDSAPERARALIDVNHRAMANPALAVRRALPADRICRPGRYAPTVEQLSVHFHEGDRSIFPRREHGISASKVGPANCADWMRRRAARSLAPPSASPRSRAGFRRRRPALASERIAPPPRPASPAGRFRWRTRRRVPASHRRAVRSPRRAPGLRSGAPAR